MRRALLGAIAVFAALGAAAPVASAGDNCYTPRVGSFNTVQVCTPIPIDPR